MKGDEEMNGLDNEAVKKTMGTMHEQWLARIRPSVERITAEMAREILAKNTNNRSMNNGTVAFYMEQMEKGQWQLNGESVKIAADGTLLDGQHRLEAISRLGLAFDTLVVRGIDKETFATIDNGKTRTFADHMKISGMKGCNLAVLAAAARIVMTFTKEGQYVDNVRKYTPTDIIDFCESNEGRWLAKSVESLPDSLNKLVPRSLGSALHYLFSCVDITKAESFFQSLATGASLQDGSPILTLRNRLIAYNSEAGGSGRSGRRQLISYFIQAFNAHREERELRNVSYTPNKDVYIDGIR